MAIEIVDIFPWKIVIFHSYVSHYQRVYEITVSHVGFTQI